jgi:hypothetical protein
LPPCTPNQALEPTPNSLRSCLAPALGRGSPRAFGVNSSDGFDGNTEGEYMSIARFLVEKMGRFEALKGRDFNSHVPVVDRYRVMSAAFEPMRTRLIGRELSVGELIELLKLQ